MRYSGIQPQYFPRLHYFARALQSDVFVFRDDVQFVRKHKYPDGRTDKSFQVHTPIKQSFGIQLLSVPVQSSGFPTLITTPVSRSVDWAGAQLKTLQIAYGQSPNFAEVYEEINKIMYTPYVYLADLNIATVLWGILRLLGVKRINPKQLTLETVNRKLAVKRPVRLKTIKKASQSRALPKLVHATANEKIFSLIKEAGADEDYCGGTAYAAYMDQEGYRKHGITITVQEWVCPEYPQRFTRQLGFLPNLSIIDLLMNVPAKQALSILTQ
ncbi:MAG: hypothetical protein A2786_03940 [Candidatus Chisholmbacteria bacterium RIFCSPHIGHO2_01_FULL_52_32]|uniref:Uncharacterized protein n=1 Tax=Candidatus Chisholmbacteria bacterium RIFCSPHIGHO2_01_FULL_52_32 TaxID=1797591 RepID=A0A1G1VTA7_9BACT|nr:MAG: hypothetical protein A2786_03940 [Candidatus Chisholmbacteria bacterium RIFCSPHIGHO2_01_FULL_52_32]